MTGHRILFRTQDLSAVKSYCTKSWLKLIENRLTIEDFIFAKEVRMGTYRLEHQWTGLQLLILIYSDKGPPPPGVTVAARRMMEDPNDEPQYGERVPYVIVKGRPGAKLVDRAVSPEDVLKDLCGFYRHTGLLSLTGFSVTRLWMLHTTSTMFSSHHWKESSISWALM